MAGKPVHVTVTGTSHGQSESRTSADTAAVQAPRHHRFDSTVPTISGSPVVSRPLTAARGAWTAGTAFAFQWLADDVPIAGATANTFSPTADQRSQVPQGPGHRDQEPATATRSARPRPSAPVTYAPWSPVVPTIIGTPTYPNALSTAPFWGSEGSYTYQWLNNGVAIAGATSARYVPPASLVGSQPQGAGRRHARGTPTSLLSVASKYAPGTLTGATPTISGTTKVGRTLTAVPGTWTAGTTRKYQWYAAVDRHQIGHQQHVQADDRAEGQAGLGAGDRHEARLHHPREGLRQVGAGELKQASVEHAGNSTRVEFAGCPPPPRAPSPTSSAAGPTNSCPRCSRHDPTWARRRRTTPRSWPRGWSSRPRSCGRWTASTHSS